jgi:hypothetical protein
LPSDTSRGGLSEKPKLPNLDGDRHEGETLDVHSSFLITSFNTQKQVGILKVIKHSESLDWKEQFSEFQALRGKIADILYGAGRIREANNVRHCGEDFKASLALCCGDTIAHPVFCGHRLCPVCMRRRSNRLSDKVVKFIEGAFFKVPVEGNKGEFKKRFIKMKHPLMITLTKRNVPKLTKKAYTDFKHDIVKLRHRDIFKDCVGGFDSIETTRNSETRTWHLHNHMIVDSPHIKQDELSKEWLDITGDSYIVDIREIKDPEKAAREVAKYVVKPGDFLQDPELVSEYLEAVKGSRLVSTFGKYYCISLDEEEGGLPECSCKKNQWHEIEGFYYIDNVYRDIKGFYRLKVIISDA